MARRSGRGRGRSRGLKQIHHEISSAAEAIENGEKEVTKGETSGIEDDEELGDARDGVSFEGMDSEDGKCIRGREYGDFNVKEDEGIQKMGNDEESIEMGFSPIVLSI